MKTDALGNEIVIGNTYGYSTNRNGFSYVILGIAKKVSEKYVFLDIISRRSALYEHELYKDNIHTGKSVSVRGYQLFPVDMNDVNNDVIK